MSVFDPKNNSNNLGNQTNPNAESKNEVIAPEVDAIFGNPAVVSLVEGAKYAGFGGVCGYCTGAAVKSIGKQIAGVLGAAFIGLQVLNYYGYIGNVNYDRISQDVSKVLDVVRSLIISALIMDITVLIERVCLCDCV